LIKEYSNLNSNLKIKLIPESKTNKIKLHGNTKTQATENGMTT
jgi:hypothetical protein